MPDPTPATDEIVAFRWTGETRLPRSGDMFYWGGQLLELPRTADPHGYGACRIFAPIRASQLARERASREAAEQVLKRAADYMNTRDDLGNTGKDNLARDLDTALAALRALESHP